MLAQKQLITDIHQDAEWQYLVGETLIGERMIVQALAKIVRDKSLPSDLLALLEEQLDEEAYHLNEYSRVLGSKSIQGSGYDLDLHHFVDSLPNNTLKLYALQGLLEGISLGALKHRIDHWQDASSFELDKEVYEDEKKHVSLSFDYFDQLIHQEGQFKLDSFNNITLQVKKIFNKAFNADTISRVIKKMTGVAVNAKKIESNTAMHEFQKLSRQEIIENRDKFLGHYYKNA